MFLLNSRKRSQSGVTLLMTAVLLVIILAMVGLAVDSGYLYLVKAKLQTAVDGASLAAARALVLGQTTAAQRTSAQQNATNWFYANFPSGALGTRNTVLDTPVVADDAVNPMVRNVTVSARTTVNPFFMGLVGAATVDVRAMGNAARRDVVVMLVLDKSGSMNSNSACANMRMAAKLFTGQFAAGRDRVGLVAFSDTIDTTTIRPPATDFQNVLGYNNSSGSGTGLLDTITCSGGTSTAQAISVGYNGILTTNLPGALNVLMLMTDGLPNVMTINLEQPFPGTPTITALKSTSGCKDTQNKTLAGGGNFVTYTPNWTPGVNFSTYFSGSTLSLPAGMITTIGTYDPPSTGVWGGIKYMGTPTQVISTTNAPGCSFSTSNNYTNFRNDISWIPNTDVYGNRLDTGYKTPLTRDGNGRIIASNGTNVRWGSFNTTDDAARTVRTGGIPSYLFVVGLGGTTGAPPEYGLLQRVANDPNPDLYNTPALYGSYTPQANQPQGTFIFSSSPAELGQAFLRISSMILRLSQ
ncbi:MAG: VWA domain-containing protein [Acidobacteria bacterium]|nr:VWA domain-containing protein [Acidobacteriota bacterium]